MKKSLCFLLAVLLLSFGGCRSEDQILSDALKFRTDLIREGACRFQGEITANFGETEDHFTVDCKVTSDGAAELTVVEPECIRGICATVTEGGGRLSFEGLAMEFGLLAQERFSPVALPALVVESWSKAYISAAGYEGECYRVTYENGYDSDTIKIDTWYEKKLPFYVEVCYNNIQVIKMNITAFSWGDEG